MTLIQDIVNTVRLAGGPISWPDLKAKLAEAGHRRLGHKRFVEAIRLLEREGELKKARWIGGDDGAWCSDIERQPEVPCSCPNQLLDRSCCGERITKVLLSDTPPDLVTLDWSGRALRLRPRPDWVRLGLKGAGVRDKVPAGE